MEKSSSTENLDVRAPQRKRKAANDDQPAFLRKTFQMIDKCPSSIGGWSERGDTFFVKDVERFSEEIIPTEFKHNNFSSFVRQLNFYGFRKLKAATHHGQNWLEFRHPLFRRGAPNLLSEIKRSAHLSDGRHSDIPEFQDVVAKLSRLDDQVTKLADTVGRITSQQVFLGDVLEEGKRPKHATTNVDSGIKQEPSNEPYESYSGSDDQSWEDAQYFARFFASIDGGEEFLPGPETEGSAFTHGSSSSSSSSSSSQPLNLEGSMQPAAVESPPQLPSGARALGGSDPADADAASVCSHGTPPAGGGTGLLDAPPQSNRQPLAAGSQVVTLERPVVPADKATSAQEFRQRETVRTRTGEVVGTGVGVEGGPGERGSGRAPSRTSESSVAPNANANEPMTINNFTAVMQALTPGLQERFVDRLADVVGSLIAHQVRMTGLSAPLVTVVAPSSTPDTGFPGSDMADPRGGDYLSPIQSFGGDRAAGSDAATSTAGLPSSSTSSSSSTVGQRRSDAPSSSSLAMGASGPSVSPSATGNGTWLKYPEPPSGCGVPNCTFCPPLAPVPTPVPAPSSRPPERAPRVPTSFRGGGGSALDVEACEYCGCPRRGCTGYSFDPLVCALISCAVTSHASACASGCQLIDSDNAPTSGAGASSSISGRHK